MTKAAKILPPTPLQEAEAEHARLSAAMEAAAGNLAEARRRESETQAALEAATASVQQASMQMVEDELSERLFDDATGAMTRAAARLKVLQEHVIPAASQQVAAREGELEAAQIELDSQRLRADVIERLLPIDRRLISAMQEAGDAFQEMRALTGDLLRRFSHVRPTLRDDLSPGFVARAIPTDLARQTWPEHHQNGAVTLKQTGGDLLAARRQRFGLTEEETV